MWKSKQGTTTFDFSIRFQKEVEPNEWVFADVEADGALPSSYWSQKTGGIRYIVAGVVYVKNGSKIKVPIAAYRDLKVVESIPFLMKPEFPTKISLKSRLMAEKSEKVKRNVLNIGKKGTVVLNATLRVPSTENSYDTGVWISGNSALVGVDIKNHSARWVREVSATLFQRFQTFIQKENKKEKCSDLDTGFTLTPVSFVRRPIAGKVLKVTKTPLTSGITALTGKLHGLGPIDDDVTVKKDKNGRDVVEHWGGVAPGATTSIVLDFIIPVSFLV